MDAALRQVVELHLQVGQENPNEREAAQNALKALLKGRDGTPFRRGQKSNVPASVRVAIDRICAVVKEANLAYYNYDGVISSLSFKHNKSGGGLYEDADEFAAEQRKCEQNFLLFTVKVIGMEALIRFFLQKNLLKSELNNSKVIA